MLTKNDNEKMDYIRKIVVEELEKHENSWFLKMASILQHTVCSQCQQTNWSNTAEKLGQPVDYIPSTQVTDQTNHEPRIRNRQQIDSKNSADFNRNSNGECTTQPNNECLMNREPTKTFSLPPTKLVIVGDSITSAVNRRHMSNITGIDTSIRSNPGGVSENVTEPKMDVAKHVILHVGTNNITSRNPEFRAKTPQQLADKITAKLSSLANLEAKPTVYYSSMLHRFDVGDKDGSTDRINKLIDDANGIIKSFCADNGHYFIDHSTIEQTDLHDSLHLNVDGGNKFMNNIANAVAPNDDNDIFVKRNVKRIGERANRRARNPNGQSMANKPLNIDPIFNNLQPNIWPMLPQNRFLPFPFPR